MGDGTTNPEQTDPPMSDYENDRPKSPPVAPWRRKMHEVIFEADTGAGKAFDVALLVAILLSVVAVMLESVDTVEEAWGPSLRAAEWGFTVLFTIEYVLRLICVGRPWRYARSFFGLVDLTAVLPTYVSLVFAGSQSLMVIRIVRLIRVFRVFKLTRYLAEAKTLMQALRATRAKITVFLVTIMSLIFVIGAAMYLIEGGQPDTDFTSIPQSVYWAIVTMTTVGYGDIAPQTPVGQALAAMVMILGYSIIIVPTGIFSAEVIASHGRGLSGRSCPGCGAQGHDMDADHCKYCGTRLQRGETAQGA